jgi:hypothetical protein
MNDEVNGGKTEEKKNKADPCLHFSYSNRSTTVRKLSLKSNSK